MRSSIYAFRADCRMDSESDTNVFRTPEPPDISAHLTFSINSDLLVPLVDATPPVTSAPPLLGILTDHAKKYGIIDHDLYKNSGKSGFTPIDLPGFIDTHYKQKADLVKRLVLVRHQRKYLTTFTTWELQDQACLYRYNAKSNDLLPPLHPLVQRDRWFRLGGPLRPEVPIGDAFEGIWDSKNDTVWEILRPILGIVTHIMTNTNFWLFFDAMFLGSKKRLPKDVCAADGGPDQDLFSILCRKPEEAERDADGVKGAFKSMAKKVRFYVDTYVTCKPGSTRMINGCTIPMLDKDGGYRNSCIFINYHHLVPLLKMDLTTSERLVQNLAVAKTVSGALLDVFTC